MILMYLHLSPDFSLTKYTGCKIGLLSIKYSNVVLNV